METPLIEFRDVTKRFNGRPVLDQVNLKIYEGHVTTLIGKSGTGKSVLLKHIIGLLSPDGGRILFKGKSIETMKRREWDSYRSQFSYMFQNNALFDSMTVFENIALPLRERTGMSRMQIADKVMEKMVQMELAEVPDKYPSELSGGMQKRVALARALITDPKIVLFDEPTTGQDPIRKNAILSMIAHNQKRFGFTTIMISHDIPDIFFISHRILILYDGRIEFQGNYTELDQLDHPMIGEFIKSLEGFQDELTGLYSKNNFTRRYEETLTHKRPHEGFSVALFTINQLDLLSHYLGPTEEQGVIRSLGEWVSRYFGNIGISARLGRDQITTLVPNASLEEVEPILEGLAKDLQKSGLSDIGLSDPVAVDREDCFEFNVLAGVAEGKLGEDIDITSNRARSNQKTIARFRCEKRR